MGRLRAAMTSKYKERDEDVKIHTPRNLEILNLSFRGERVAKVSNRAQHRHLPSSLPRGLLAALSTPYYMI